jgi:hypothetical protein
MWEKGFYLNLHYLHVAVPKSGYIYRGEDLHETLVRLSISGDNDMIRVHENLIWFVNAHTNSGMLPERGLDRSGKVSQ